MVKTNKLKNNGSVFAFVLLAFLLFFVTCLGFMSLTAHRQLLAGRFVAEIAARSAADAGVADAVAQMGQKTKIAPWDDAALPFTENHPLPNSNATFSYSISGAHETGFTIESVGQSDGAVTTANALIEEQSCFDFGILVKESIDLKNAALVTAYTSSDPTVEDTGVLIASANWDRDSIILMSASAVNGQVLTGVNFDFESVIVPLLPPRELPIHVAGNTLTIGPPQSGEYAFVRILNADETPGVLEINGGHVDLYVLGGLIMGRDCEIRIRKGSSLTIYLGGNFISRDAAGISNENAVPADCILYGTASEKQSLDLKARNNWYGAVYAPNARITVRANGDLHGSFVGTSFEMKSSGEFKYDTALRNYGESRFVVKRSWRQPETSSSPL